MAPGVLNSHWAMDLALPIGDELEIADMLALPHRAARRVMTALELHGRLIRLAIPQRIQVLKPEDVVVGMAALSDLPEEHFYCLPLNVRGEMIGDPTPSDVDVAVTKRLILAGRAVDITLQDHVVVRSVQRYVSFRKNMPGLLKN